MNRPKSRGVRTGRAPRVYDEAAKQTCSPLTAGTNRNDRSKGRIAVQRYRQSLGQRNRHIAGGTPTHGSPPDTRPSSRLESEVSMPVRSRDPDSIPAVRIVPAGLNSWARRSHHVCAIRQRPDCLHVDRADIAGLERRILLHDDPRAGQNYCRGRHGVALGQMLDQFLERAP